MTHDHTKALDDMIAAVENGEFLLGAMRGRLEDNAFDAFYGSLDAANALHEALLPGVMWQRCPTGQFCLFDTYVEEIGHSFDTAKNPARAWLIAILKAYRAQVDA